MNGFSKGLIATGGRQDPVLSQPLRKMTNHVFVCFLNNLYHLAKDISAYNLTFYSRNLVTNKATHVFLIDDNLFIFLLENVVIKVYPSDCMESDGGRGCMYFISKNIKDTSG